MKELMAQYGEKMIQAEILNAQIQQIKQQIAQKMNEKSEMINSVAKGIKKPEAKVEPKDK